MAKTNGLELPHYFTESRPNSAKLDGKKEHSITCTVEIKLIRVRAGIFDREEIRQAVSRNYTAGRIFCVSYVAKYPCLLQ